MAPAGESKPLRKVCVGCALFALLATTGCAGATADMPTRSPADLWIVGADEAPTPRVLVRPRLTHPITVAVQKPWEIRPGPWFSSPPAAQQSPWFDESHEDDWEADDPDDPGLDTSPDVPGDMGTTLEVWGRLPDAPP